MCDPGGPARWSSRPSPPSHDVLSFSSALVIHDCSGRVRAFTGLHAAERGPERQLSKLAASQCQGKGRYVASSLSSIPPSAPHTFSPLSCLRQRVEQVSPVPGQQWYKRPSRGCSLRRRQIGVPATAPLLESTQTGGAGALPLAIRIRIRTTALDVAAADHPGQGL